MSSYATPVNQSTDSGTSSLQRSGLNISVGDTKSIVLALQALQGKIRALEQDRDYHQERYEGAVRAHETYKTDMERQMETERMAHRRREEELHSQLRKAQEDKTRLESVLDGTGADELRSFREELEHMIVSEKHMAQEREQKLQTEVERLRRETAEEKTKHAALQATFAQLEGQRSSACQTNQELRHALQDLVARCGRRGGKEPPLQRSSRGRAARAPPFHGGGVDRSAWLPSKEGERYTYRDPTCNSLLRDIRSAAVAPLCCPRSEGDVSSFVAAAPHHLSSHLSAPRAPSRHRSTSSAKDSPGRRWPTRPPRPSRTEGHANPAFGAVYRQLEEELADLQAQYEETIARGAGESIPRSVLTTAINRLSSRIDQKVEQLRLMKEAQKELVESGGAGGPVTSAAAEGEGEAVYGKTPRRNMLVNELRSMLAQSVGK